MSPALALRKIARRAALKVPPVRRLYDRADRADRLVAEATGRADRFVAELAAAAEERDSLDLQLYALRSEHQRTIGRNEELSKTLEVAERRVRELEETQSARARALESATKRLRELEAASNSSPTLADAALAARHLDLVYAKLSAKLTMLAGEVNAALRAGAQPENGDSSALLRIRVLYLDLLEKAVTGSLGADPAIGPRSSGCDPEVRLIGRDWPATAQTMIGLARLRNIRMLAEQVIEQGIPGDFLEAGVWRGGACIYMRGLLAAHGIADRTVWVADSFEGLPPPDPAAYPADAGDPHRTFKELRVPLEEVQGNFERYGLLDDQVRFLKGWFADTLPQAPISQLALLRLDGDMYSSTTQTLHALYKKVSPGGGVIIGDYLQEGCRRAVDDFRRQFGISEPIQDVDGTAVYWCKAA